MRADSWRIEADLVPVDLDDAVELRARIIEAGYSAVIASGILGWLLDKDAGFDRTSNSQRTKYRKVLADVFGRDTIPGLREAA